MGVDRSAVITASAQALQMPILAKRAVIQKVEHPVAGPMPLVRSPVRFLDRFEDTRMKPAPLLGEHTTEILRELLNYPTSQIEALLRDGAIAGNQSKAPASGQRNATQGQA